MEFFLLILFLCFFIFLFYLHYSAKEDFVFIRKNVSLEQLFDVAVITGLCALFTSRLMYVLFHPSVTYFNPLVFFGLPYFPGLSVAGGVIGAGLYLLFYGRTQRPLAARISDFFSISLLFVLPIGFLIAGLITKGSELFIFSIAAVFSFILFLLFSRVFFPKLIGGQYKDGVISYLFLMNFSLSFLLSHIISRASLQQFYFTTEDAVFMVIFFLGLLLFVRQEHLGSRKRILK